MAQSFVQASQFQSVRDLLHCHHYTLGAVAHFKINARISHSEVRLNDTSLFYFHPKFSSALCEVCYLLPDLQGWLAKLG